LNPRPPEYKGVTIRLWRPKGMLGSESSQSLVFVSALLKLKDWNRPTEN
jgi:hypothetical protein